MAVERQRLRQRGVEYRSVGKRWRVFWMIAATMTFIAGCVVFDASEGHPESPIEGPKTSDETLDPNSLRQILHRCHAVVSPGAMYNAPVHDEKHLVREWDSGTRLDMFTQVIDTGGQFLATTVFGLPPGKVVYVPVKLVTVWDGCGEGAYVENIGRDPSGVPLGRIYRDPDKKTLISHEEGYARASFQENK